MKDTALGVALGLAAVVTVVLIIWSLAILGHATFGVNP